MSLTTTTCGHRRDGGEVVCAQPHGHVADHSDTDGHTWHNRGPLQRYEIVWISGHVETVPAHQVSYPHRGFASIAGLLGSMTAEGGQPRVQLHAEIDGHWLLTLSALEEDIRSMRLVTEAEVIPR